MRTSQTPLLVSLRSATDLACSPHLANSLLLMPLSARIQTVTRMKPLRLLQCILFLAALTGAPFCSQPALAQQFPSWMPQWLAQSDCGKLPAPKLSSADNSFGASIVDYVSEGWVRDEALQPDWIAPLATTTATPTLRPQLRYDQIWQANPRGVATDNFGGGKGVGGTSPGGFGDGLNVLELPLLPNTEVVLGMPAWIAHNGAIQHPTKSNPHPATDGWSDETFWLKRRLFCGPINAGNYIVTALINFSAPTGTAGNSMGHAVFTPMIAAGKGFNDLAGAGRGNFDIQANVGISLPDGGLQRLGMPLAWNTVFQYEKPVPLTSLIIWPEFEVNYTWWPNGKREGQTQVFLTPGVILSKIPLFSPLTLILGVGYQVAVTSNPAYNHSVILSARIPIPKPAKSQSN